MFEDLDFKDLPKDGSGSLRDRIDRAKEKLPLPELMEQYGDGSAAATSARCPFHGDTHPSFSVYRGTDGNWRWNCFAGCGEGDEIDYVKEKEGYDTADAIRHYLELAEDGPAELDAAWREDDEDDDGRDYGW